jgi:protein Tob/BTG
MRAEIESAVNFLTKLIAKNNESSLVITPETIDLFSEKLCQLLTEKFQNHWFPEKPIKGQAFRCIRFNENIRRDLIVEKACKEAGINYDDLKLPLELTLWVDPHEVTCRFGEHKGSYCIVAKHRDGRQEDYIDSINIEELEKKTIERNHNASFDLMNSRKKRTNGRKNGYNSNGYSNGYTDYSMIGSGSPSSSFYPFYGSGTPFATHYSSSPPNGNNGFKYPLSPTQSRAVGNQSFRGMNNKTNYSNQSINSKANNQNFSRQLFTNGNGFQSPFAYQPNDRYHWVNKSMAKA